MKIKGIFYKPEKEDGWWIVTCVHLLPTVYYDTYNYENCIGICWLFWELKLTWGDRSPKITDKED